MAGGIWELATMLREQVNATAKRSDVLKPLAWLTGIIATLLAILAISKAPEWLMYWASLLLIALIALYAMSYLFCLFFDRDALRSESFALNKMAIEQKLLGDSTSGLFEAQEVSDNKPLIVDQAPKRITRRRSPKPSEGEE